MEDIAAHTMHKIMDHARKKSQIDEFQSIKQPLSALCELWVLKCKQEEMEEMRVFQASQDLTLSINLYVAGCEDVLLATDVSRG